MLGESAIRSLIGSVGGRILTHYDVLEVSHLASQEVIAGYDSSGKLIMSLKPTSETGTWFMASGESIGFKATEVYPPPGLKTMRLVYKTSYGSF